jgi:hypothetical protein
MHLLRLAALPAEWRDRDDMADVAAYVRGIRADRFNGTTLAISNRERRPALHVQVA